MDKTDLSLIFSALGLLVSTLGVLITIGAGQFVIGLLSGLLLATLAGPTLKRRSRGDP